MGEPLFEGVGSRTVKLISRESQLVPEETSLVREWEGNAGPGQIGFLTPPGVPVEGSVTTVRMQKWLHRRPDSVPTARSYWEFFPPAHEHLARR